MPTVTIKTRANEGKPLECAPSPDPCGANPGDTVTFVFPGIDADIIFEGSSPFAAQRFKAGIPQKVRDVEKPTPPAKSVRFKYRVEWLGGGSGGGTVEVPPG